LRCDNVERDAEQTGCIAASVTAHGFADCFDICPVLKGEAACGRCVTRGGVSVRAALCVARVISTIRLSGNQLIVQV
jgi:hypothetical protein